MWAMRLSSVFVLFVTVEHLASPLSAFQPIHVPSFQPHRALSFVPRADTRLGSSADESIDASDLGLLQKTFAKYADEDGLMTRVEVMQVPGISQLLVDGDLMTEELTLIWDKAPKFPEVDVSEERIDVDAFVQMYRAIDDLFEEDEEKDSATAEVEASAVDSSSSVDETAEEVEDSELVEVFAIIAKDGTLTKEQLRGWDEVETLVADGMLGEDEFDSLWKESTTGKSDIMDSDTFMDFNDKLDSLFEFSEEDLEDEYEEIDADETKASVATEKLPMVEGDVGPEELFLLLKSSEGSVGVAELKRWGELQEMIADRDVSATELDDMFEKALELSKLDDALDQTGFASFCKSIDDLFEEDNDEEEQAAQATKSVAAEDLGVSPLKEDLLRALSILNKDEERLPCGLESTEEEKQLVLDLASELENDNTNQIRIRGTDVEPDDLTGEWEMLYTSSSAMKFNKGLSGLGGSFPNGKFGGLKQTLSTTAVLSDVEYSEFIDVKPDTASFDVKINGSWDLRKSISLFTGEPSIVLSVEPNRVSYGPTSTRADHWKSLGPMNMLDITYLDDELRIMRGNTAVETVFIFKRL